jgi:hypothetical protein
MAKLKYKIIVFVVKKYYVLVTNEKLFLINGEKL